MEERRQIFLIEEFQIQKHPLYQEMELIPPLFFAWVWAKFSDSLPKNIGGKWKK